MTLAKNLAVDGHDLSRSTSGLRLTVAVNHFKRMLLGGRHLPGKAQTPVVFEFVEQAAINLSPKLLSSHSSFDPLGWIGMRITPRTWQGWFGQGVSVPKLTKLEALDKVSAHMFRWICPADGAAQQLPSNFYASLVSGGLMSALLAPTDSKDLLDLVRARANAYHPVSAWHLHMDAMEVRAFTEDFGDVQWSQIVKIAASRILEVLHDLWRPEGGRVFPAFSSHTKLRLEGASIEERQEAREFFSRFKPDMFDRRMGGGARPSWDVVGYGPDVQPGHVHRLLFSIGADSDFLQGDRLSAWALDLATAGLAAHALAWTDRYRLLGGRLTEEMIYLAAFEALLFTVSPSRGKFSDEDEAGYLEEIGMQLGDAMESSPSCWDACGKAALYSARATYKSELAELGVSLEAVESLCGQSRSVHVLRYTK